MSGITKVSTLVDNRSHIDRIKYLMWKQTEVHPLGMPKYFASTNYSWRFDGSKLSNTEYNERFRICSVKKTHRFIRNLVRKSFGAEIPIWFFIDRHSDTENKEGDAVSGRFHSHFYIGDISDDAISNPSPCLMPLFYKEDDSGIPINMRNVDIEGMKLLLLDACLRQSKWIGKYPKALKLDCVPPEEMEQCFYYCLNKINGKTLDKMDTVVDWGNSSFYKP